MEREPLRVFLYRRDRTSQLESWERACRLGIWHEEDWGVPATFPADAPAIIEHAAQTFGPLADLQVAYETMVSQWADTIARILRAAGWSQEPLPMARQKISRGRPEK
ncbi:hypothetical protein [Crateriforma conspicua]|uniref:Uncharacterized protein n=1 Tax=Crateriforma conspicua TaxID=2527996 RepID=A0A5C6FVK3_9PLAN|nr:hypothetical protein [Crateriforma conspicua]TWU66441.1 hypothetical protein V7x_20070 [Crateriforma conspicua]